MILAETGVSNEEVEAFIQGPDPVTKEYTCLYEGCKFKPFARKENIRSHIQTHLGDRKFVCGTCKSRFVRPNDLKRHAVIHQSSRDFICICGAAFGRKDALRRHKLRNEKCARDEPGLQVLKKEEKKRGRPRKVAPTETVERRERKERIRKQVMHKKRKGSVPSSVATSYPSPGAEMSSPEMQSSQPMFPEYSPTMEMAYTPPASPEDVIVDPPLSLPVKTQYGPTDSLSPPPTRGSMSAGFEGIPTIEESKNILEMVDFGAAADFSTDAFGLTDGPLSQTSSSYGGSPADLGPLSSSPAPAGAKPVESSFHDFGSSSTDDFDFGSARSGADDVLALFGDQPMATGLAKSDCDLGALSISHRDDSFWGRFSGDI